MKKKFDSLNETKLIFAWGMLLICPGGPQIVLSRHVIGWSLVVFSLFFATLAVFSLFWECILKYIFTDVAIPPTPIALFSQINPLYFLFGLLMLCLLWSVSGIELWYKNGFPSRMSSKSE